VLGVGGQVGYRDRFGSGTQPARAPTGTFTTLPASWPATTKYAGNDGPISAYADLTP
jgi:hypothetical protein